MAQAPLHFAMNARGQSIVLIGFMGAGKSSTGRALARRTGLLCFDTDEIVSTRFGLSVTEIFVQLGEEEFRNAETEALRQLSAAVPAIIVTGGGVVLRPGNVKMLRELGRVVSLEADEETLFRRISRRATRPLLQTENPRATLVELLRVRNPLYHAAADVRLDTSRLAHDEVADAILKYIEQL
jgi:shikimate kinase